MTEDENFIEDALDWNDGKLGKWLAREKAVYQAHTGRDGTEEGFRKHCMTIAERDPAVSDMLFEAFVMAAWEQP